MKKRFRTKKNNLKIFGPGIITGASDNDPSGIGTYSIAGAKYGLLTAWLMPFLFPFMYVIQEMCGRIGVVTGRGLIANMRTVFPKTVLYSVVFLLFVANSFNIGANVAVMAESAKLIIDINIDILAVSIVIITVLLEILVAYRNYAKILMVSTIFLFAYIITSFIVSEHWIDIVRNIFTPHIQFDKNFILIVAGCIGTTISPYLFFWQTSQEVEERLDHKDKNYSDKHVKKMLRNMRLDTIVGSFFSQIIALFIIITCFSTLYKNGITDIVSAHDAALALKPLAGEWAFLFFTIGILGAGFLGIPVLAASAAYAASEIFNSREGLAYKFKDALFFYGIIICAMAIGLIIHFLDIHPIKALLYAAVINGIVAVPIILFIVILANKREIMGSYKNSTFSNFFSGCLLVIMSLVAFLTIFF